MKYYIIFFITFFAAAAEAQWVSDSTVNTPVCTALYTQQNPHACSDGADGILIVWEDFRSGANWDLYAQKLNANGVRQWGSNGVLVSTSIKGETNPVICSDDSGGAYIVWEDDRSITYTGIDLYAQHIIANGTLGYSASGIEIASGNGNQQHAAITDDGKGNAFVAWEDNRTSIYLTTRPNIWMNKLSPSGVQWANEGTEIIDQAGKQINPRLIADGNGGCLLAWENEGSLPASIWGTVVNSSGTVMWPNVGNHTGKGIYGGLSGNTSRNINISRDGSQFLFAWEEKDNANFATKGWNVLAQRVKSDGNFVWGTASAASDVSTDYIGDQTNPIIFSDDSIATFFGGGKAAGMMVVYEDYSSDKNIVFSRVLGDGSTLRPAYPNQLFQVCRLPNIQQNSKAVKSGTGEVIIAWEDQRSSSTGATTSIYAQRVDRTPKRLMGPSPSTSQWGLALSNKKNVVCAELQLVPRSNGAIAVWRDNRNGNYDIYSQIVFKDGTLPVELSDFSASLRENGKVLLNWQTASEKENAGFEVERRMISDPNASNNFEVVGSYETNASLRGSGYTNSKKNYSFLDEPKRNGVYEYRLADISLDGERTTHEVRTIDLQTSDIATQWNVDQNYPNPFHGRTTIGFETPVQAIVQLDIFDVLGRKIASPVAGILLDQGFHTATISSDELPSSSAFYYTLSAYDPQNKTLLWKMSKAALMRNLK